MLGDEREREFVIMFSIAHKVDKER